MPMPQLSLAVGSFFATNIYVSSVVGADPDTDGMQKGVDAADARLHVAVAARIAADDKVTRAEAIRDYCWRVVGSTTITLERKVKGEFDPKSKEYKGYFPVTPASIISAPERTRAEAFETVLETAGAARQPKNIAAAAKAFVQGWAKYADAEKKVVAAEKGREKARDKEVEAKQACIVAWRELEGRLQSKYPQDLKHVRSFFPKGAPAKKKKEEVAPAPAPAPGPVAES